MRPQYLKQWQAMWWFLGYNVSSNTFCIQPTSSQKEYIRGSHIAAVLSDSAERLCRNDSIKYRPNHISSLRVLQTQFKSMMLPWCLFFGNLKFFPSAYKCLEEHETDFQLWQLNIVLARVVQYSIYYLCLNKVFKRGQHAILTQYIKSVQWT